MHSPCLTHSTPSLDWVNSFPQRALGTIKHLEHAEESCWPSHIILKSFLQSSFKFLKKKNANLNKISLANNIYIWWENTGSVWNELIVNSCLQRPFKIMKVICIINCATECCCPLHKSSLMYSINNINTCSITQDNPNLCPFCS